MRHEMGAIAPDLLIRRNGTKHNFCELSALERPICDASITRVLVRKILGLYNIDIVCLYTHTPLPPKAF
jgi:hypothetical protein